MRFLKLLVAAWASIALCVAPAAAGPPRPAQTEMGKAVGKCLLALGVGGILGGVFGGGRGASLGLKAGGALCAVLLVAAKQQDRIMAAQREAAMRGEADTRQIEVDGKPTTLQTTTTPVADPGAVRPVEYTQDGQKHVSPDLGAGTPVCRMENSSLATASGGTTALPGQLYCHTANNEWEPYAQAKT